MSPNDILMTILRSPGLFVIGIVCTFSRPPAKHHSASNAMIVSVIYNPDNLSYLNSLPHKAKQFHHWPTSPDAFFESLNRELLFSQEITAVVYKAIPGYTVTQSNSIHLSRYTRCRTRENVCFTSSSSYPRVLSSIPYSHQRSY